MKDNQEISYRDKNIVSQIDSENLDQLSIDEIRLRLSQYQDLIENIHDALFSVDINGVMTYISPVITNISGIPPKDIIGKNFVEFIHPDDRELVKNMFTLVLTGKKAPSEYRILDSRGKYKWIRTYSRRIMIDDKPAGINGVLTDITEEKEIRKELSTSREMYRALAENSADIIMRFDRQFRHIFVNSAISRYLDMHPNIMLGRTHDDLGFPEEKCRIWQNHIQRVFDTGKSHTVEFDMETPSGKIVFDWSLIPEFSPDGTVESVMITARDITRHKQFEEELAKADKLESIGTLAGGIAHEFNNILTSAIGNISLARMDVNNAQGISGYLIDAEKAILRVRELTQQMLTFSEGGDPIKTPSNVVDILKKYAHFALLGSKVKCNIKAANDLHNVVVDEAQIGQVINNITLNAKQAMNDSGTISIYAENVILSENYPKPVRPGKYIRITIEDHGHGIPEEILNKIFDPFFSTRNNNGLGLAVAYSIIKKHSGLIECQSRVGRGTIFAIYLPAADQDRLYKKSSQSGFEITKKGRLLFMDDEPVVRKIVEKTFKRLGYEIDVVGDTDEAVDLFLQAFTRGQNYDVIILDLIVKGEKDGLEAIRELLAIDPDLKAILCTGFKNDPVVQSFKDYGFKDLILKPFKPEDLENLVESVINS